MFKDFGKLLCYIFLLIIDIATFVVFVFSNSFTEAAIIFFNGIILVLGILSLVIEEKDEKSIYTKIPLKQKETFETSIY